MSFPFSGILVRYAATRAPDSGAEVHKPVEGASDCGPLDQLHVNLWEVGASSTLDLGLMISDWRTVGAVIVDIPWKVSREQVLDLGARLNNEKTVAAIFNEVVHYDGSADLSFARISFRPSESVDLAGSQANNTGHFSLLRLPAKAYELSEIALGRGIASTQVRVSLPPQVQLAAMGSNPIYIRFRVTGIPREVYSALFTQADRNLLSSSSETRIIDFRINVRRGIPDEVFSTDDTLRFPRFKKIHLFLTIHRRQICDFESQNFVGCRSLVDEAIWNEYLNGPSPGAAADSLKKFLGYQWTATASSTGKTNQTGVKDLVVLGRFSSYNSSVGKAIRFVVLGLIFGMIGNAMWDIFKPPSQSTPQSYAMHLFEQWRLLGGLLLVFSLCVAVIWPWHRGED